MGIINWTYSYFRFIILLVYLLKPCTSIQHPLFQKQVFYVIIVIMYLKIVIYYFHIELHIFISMTGRDIFTYQSQTKEYDS